MSVDIKSECPYGQQCERADGNVIVRSSLYTSRMVADKPGDEPRERFMCALVLGPVLIIELLGETRRLHSAINSLRNQVANTPVRPVVIPGARMLEGQKDTR